MKGIIFTEFLDLVEKKFGLQMVDEIILESDLPSGGVYTAVGSYSFSEMLSLLTRLSKKTQLSIDDLLLVYAEHFFQVLLDNYPDLIQMYNDPLELLASVENHIHIEVRKIYPDAELPSFKIIEREENKLILKYTSERAMYSFGLGLMQETFKHYHQNASIHIEKIAANGTEVLFHIHKLNE